MLKALRVIAGVILISLLLYAANRAVQDCRAGLYHYDNCLWLRVRDRLGLPQANLPRMITLECVGLAILAGLYFTVKLVFPPFGRNSLSQTRPGTNDPGHALSEEGDDETS